MCIIAACSTVVAAYYAITKSGWRQEYIISSLSFSLNGETSKDGVHNISIDKLDVESGFIIDLNVLIEGIMTASYASLYNIDFTLTTETALSNVIEVYQYVDGDYQYVSMLKEFVKNDLSGYLGPNDSNSYRYMLVLSNSASSYYWDNSDLAAFDLRINASSRVVSTTDSFPYYYVANSLLSEGDTLSILQKLVQSATDIENRTIVLLDDITLNSGENIVFTTNTGIDLNGHILNLNGGTITFASTSATRKHVSLIDSKGTGSIIGNGANPSPITINTPNTIMLVEDTFATSGLVTINNASLEAFSEKIGDNIKKYDGILLAHGALPTDNVTLDVTNGLGFYITSDFFTIALDQESKTYFTQTNVNMEDGSYTLSDIPEYTSTYYLQFACKKVGSLAGAQLVSGPVTIQGYSAMSSAATLLANIPNVISSSVFLPTYEDATGKKYSWITSDYNLLTNDGIFLINGLANLASWQNQLLSIAVIVESNGNTEVYSKNITIEVMSVEERLDIFYDYSQLMFFEVGDKYSFSLAEQMKRKNNWTDEALNSNLATYNVASVAELAAKLGLHGVAVNNLYTLANSVGVSNYIEGYSSLHTINVGTSIWDHVVNDTDGVEGYVEYFTEDGVSSFLLELKQQPTFDYVSYDIDLIYTFYENNFDNTQVTQTMSKKVAIVAPTSEAILIDATKELQQPLSEYNIYNSLMTNPYQTTIELIAETTRGTAVRYELQSPCDYVTINNNVITVLPALVPDTDTEITVNAYVEGKLLPYELTFTVVGLIHNEEADIKDTNFYLRLLQEFDYNKDGWLSLREAKRVNEISAPSCQIESIKGIEFFENVTSIDLSANSIIDVSYLSNLNNLTYLNLNNNNIANINSLTYLDKLQTLYLEYNDITDITDLRYLVNISNLNVADNKISSFEAIQDYQNLNTVTIYGSNSVALTAETAYYLTMAFNNTKALYPSRTIKIYRDFNAKKQSWNPNTFERVAVEVMRNIVVTTETYDTLNLPYTYEYNGANYFIDYVSANPDLITFTKNSNDTYSYSISAPIVDTDVSIGLTVNDGTDSYNLQRLFNITVLQSPDFDKLSYIETSPGVLELAIDVIKDRVLLSELFRTFNINKTGFVQVDSANSSFLENYTLSYDECNMNSIVTLIDKGITDITGLEYFKGITSLNLSSNKITSLTPIKELNNLVSLTLSGTRYDFNELVGSTAALNDIHIEGCYDLDDIEVETSLYHMYNHFITNGSYVQIYKTEDKIWNPYTIPFAKALQQLPSTYVFMERGESYTDLKKSYNFYLYDETPENANPLTFEVNVDSYIGTFKGNFSNTLNGDSIEIKYTSYAGYSDTVYAKISTVAGTVKKIINGTEYEIDASGTYYIEMIIEFTNKIKVDIDGTYKTLEEVFPGRTIRNKVLERIVANINNYQVDADGNYILSIDDLGNLSGIGAIEVDSTYSASGDNSLVGLHYLKNVTQITIRRDCNLGDGSELINLTKIKITFSGVDLSGFDTDAIKAAQAEIGIAETGYLKIIDFECSNNYYTIFYNPNYRDDTDSTNYNNINIYYLNYLPNLNKLTVTRDNSNSGAGVYDFRGLRAYINNNNIANLNLWGNYGSVFESTISILTQTYNKYVELNGSNPTYTLSSNVFYSESNDYVFNGNNPTKAAFVVTETSATLAEKKKAEYDEFASSITDLGIKMSNNASQSYLVGYNSANFHYATNQEIANNGTIYLPRKTNAFISYDDSGNVISPEYRAFDITWRVLAVEKDTLNYVLNTIFTESSSVNGNSVLQAFNLSSYDSMGFAYNGIQNNASNVSNYDAAGNIKLQISALPQDYYFVIEGTIGENVEGNSNYYSFMYGVLVNGTNVSGTVELGTNDMTVTKAADLSLDLTSTNYAYLKDTNRLYQVVRNNTTGYYYSYRIFTDLNLRMLMFISTNSAAASAGIVQANTNCGCLFYAADIATSSTSTISSTSIGAYALTGISFNNNVSITITKNTTSLTTTLANFDKGNTTNFQKGLPLIAKMSILTLDGFEIFHHLTTINMPKKGIVDLDALANSSKLTALNLAHNMIDNISVLKNKAYLITVDLAYNLIDTTVYQATLSDNTVVYKSYFENSFSTLTSLNLQGNAGVSTIDLFALSGYYSYSNNTYTKVTGTLAGASVTSLADINVGLTGCNLDYNAVIALYNILSSSNYIVSNNIKFKNDGLHDSSATTYTKSALLGYCTDFIDLYNYLEVNNYFSGYSATLNNTIIYQNRENSALSTSFSLVTNDLFTLNNNIYTSGFVGTFVVGAYFNFLDDMYVLFDLKIITVAAEAGQSYYVQIGGTTYDESKVYKVNNAKVDARVIFDDALFNYFLGRYSSISGLEYDSNERTLIFTDSFTTLSIDSGDGNYYGIKSLKGLELLTMLTSIQANYQTITELPNWDATSGARILSFEILERNQIIPNQQGSIYWTFDEYKKLAYLSNVRTLVLKYVNGIDFTRVVLNNKTLIDYFNENTNLVRLAIEANTAFYSFDYANGVKNLNYANTLSKLRSEYGAISTNGGFTPGKLFGGARSINSFVSSESYANPLDIYQNNINPSRRNNSTALVNMYCLIANDYAYFNIFSASKNDVLYTGYDSNCDNEIGGLLVNSTSNKLSESMSTIIRYTSEIGSSEGSLRDLDNPYQKGSSYVLPTTITLNGGIKKNLNWSLSATYTGITIANNTLALTNAATGNNGSFTINTSPSNEYVVAIDTSVQDVEQPDIIANMFVELSGGTYVRANEIFSSSRLIYWVYNNDANTYHINDASNRTSKVIQHRNGETFVVTEANILSQAEILATTNINIKTVGGSGHGITSIKGLEIFVNLKSFTNVETAMTSIEELRNMKLTHFSYINQTDNFLIADWSPLYNSFDTLVSFSYGVNTGERLNYTDLSWLMGFGPQLTTIKVTGKNGYEKTLSFQYIVSWFNFNRPDTEIKYNNQIIVPREDIRKAANILEKFASTDPSITYLNNYELRINGPSGILPSAIDFGGVLYDITWTMASKYLTFDALTNRISLTNAENNDTGSAQLVARIEVDGYFYERMFTIDTTSYNVYPQMKIPKGYASLVLPSVVSYENDENLTWSIVNANGASIYQTNNNYYLLLDSLESAQPIIRSTSSITNVITDYVVFFDISSTEFNNIWVNNSFNTNYEELTIGQMAYIDICSIQKADALTRLASTFNSHDSSALGSHSNGYTELYQSAKNAIIALTNMDDVNAVTTSYINQLNTYYEEHKNLVITYYDITGAVLTTVTVEKGSIYNADYDYTIEGSTFVGWYTDQTLVNRYSPVAINNNINLYPKTILTEYSITFLDNEENVIDSVTEFGQDYTFTLQSSYELPTYTVANYSFIGWRTTEGEVITSIPLGTTGNLMLTAVMSPIYTITFFDNGGNQLSQFNRTYTTADAFDLPTYTVANYAFRGWRLPDNSIISSISQGTAGNLILTVYMLPINSITFLDQGGNEIDQTIAFGQTYTYVEDTSLTLPEYETAGLVFKGWEVMVNGVASGEIITEIAASERIGNLTLKATYAKYLLINKTGTLPSWAVGDIISASSVTLLREKLTEVEEVVGGVTTVKYVAKNVQTRHSESNYYAIVENTNNANEYRIVSVDTTNSSTTYPCTVMRNMDIVYTPDSNTITSVINPYIYFLYGINFDSTNQSWTRNRTTKTIMTWDENNNYYYFDLEKAKLTNSTKKAEFKIAEYMNSSISGTGNNNERGKNLYEYAISQKEAYQAPTSTYANGYNIGVDGSIGSPIENIKYEELIANPAWASIINNANTYIRLTFVPTANPGTIPAVQDHFINIIESPRD